MRPTWLLSAVSFLLLANLSPLARAENNAVLRRQGGSSSAPPATSNTPPPSSSSLPESQSSNIASASGASETSSAQRSSTGSSSASPRSSSASGTAVPSGGNATSSGIVFGASATPIANTTLNGTTLNGPVINGLPIQPSVTPAMAVAGALLIVTGTVYTLVGIKTERIQIFFSTTYLVALAVTVLIEYVMHPPTSNGIQGAYFVAACVSGLIFGAIAVVFADVTEGLGCFLGGFCLSMWFLVLKSDGLITSTAGKAIFIGCFSVSTFGLYISRFTRVYGLIGSTSFAGATVIVLGIDCFSRAGLKEFWLYIWNLNSAIFPLNYMGPYPITRGIRVEIAAIILLFLLGVMSQMKVWKIVKKRREERAVEQLRKEEERDRAEEALGRRIEFGNTEERSMWDAVYGDKAKLRSGAMDSGIGTEAQSTAGKSSMSVGDTRDIRDEGMEMQNLKGSRFDSRNGGRITVHVAQEDDISEAPRTMHRSSVDSTLKTSREPSIEQSPAGGTKSVVSEIASAKSKIDPSMTLKPKSKGPEFVPLPFHVPGEGHSQKASDASSVATFAASEHLPEQPKRSSKRLSGSGLVRKLSGRSQRDPVASSTSQEALMIPHIEDDRSSIAATVDDVSDDLKSDSATSFARSPRLGKDTPSDEKMVTAPQTPMLSLASQQPLDMGIDFSIDGHSPTKVPSPTTSEPRTVLDATSKTKDAESAVIPEAPQPLARQSSLTAGNLPEGGASKVVNAYRTNEWAKYLDRADAPSVEDLKTQKARAAEVNTEKPVPVNVRALSQTPLTAEPASKATNLTGDKAHLPSNRSRSSSADKPTNPYRAQQPPLANVERSTSQLSLASSTSSSPAQSLPKGRSSTTSLAPPRAFRTASSPLVGTPLVESPIEEGVESSFPHSRFTPSTTHLLSQRESILRSKPSSTSLLRTGSGTSLNHTSFASNNHSGSSVNLASLDEDDTISLSQRRSMLQQQQQSLSRSSSGTTTPYNASRNSLNPNNPYGQARLSSASNLQLNSNPPHAARPHVPAEASSPAAISNWRASLAQLPTNEVQQQQELELRRRELLAEKRAARNSQALEQRGREQRESMLGKEMRRGSMMDAHRQAMRKMQAGVNEKLKPTGT